jgi:uncharacterized phiE125 gp8 family phage protein
MRATQTVAPTTAVVTTSEAKSHLRVDSADDDTLIGAQVAAATAWVEEYTGRQLVTATWLLTLDSFPSAGEPIVLPRPPAATITSIVYTDSDETATTIDAANYTLDDSDDLRRHRILPVGGYLWPTNTRTYSGVAVTYTAGYGAAAAVPEIFKRAILLLVGDLYEQRETIVVGTSQSTIPTVERLLVNQRVSPWL